MVEARDLKRFLQRRWAVAVLLALALVLVLAGQTGILTLLLTAGLGIWALVALGSGLFRRSRIIWRLRNRLIVTYVFIAVVPTFLLLALAFIAGYVVTGQMAAYLVNKALDARAEALAGPARVLSQTPAAERAREANSIARNLIGQMPELEIFISGQPDYRYPADGKLGAPDPAWKDFTGTLTKDGRSWSAAISQAAGVTVVLLAPMTPKALEQLVPGIGSLSLLGVSVAPEAAAPGDVARRRKGLAVRVDGSDPVLRSVGTLPPSLSALDWQITWLGPVRRAVWDQPNRTQNTFVAVTTRPSSVLGIVFASGIDFAQSILVFFAVIAALFAVVELISVFIGVYMTRTITGAVHHLYEGTLRVSTGDFSSRIPVKGRDQLADLGWSFNKMTEQLEHLVEVAREKERLQSELAIASEVQKQLFPRTTPTLRNLSLCGLCEPARMVSGDYYDYLSISGGRVAMAIGDVAGKGISAALLMASIQSIMRTQLDEVGHLDIARGTGEMVAQLNRQLYANTSSEKYATFFFGLYDEATRQFTYTNAGHLQPLLISGGAWRLLEVTGTVVGAFPAIRYGEESVVLGEGDLLVSYTDGITEPENAYGEEFGLERLAETVLRHQHLETTEIAAKVMDAVRQWSSSPELPDDMTVLIARGLA